MVLFVREEVRLPTPTLWAGLAKRTLLGCAGGIGAICGTSASGADMGGEILRPKLPRAGPSRWLLRSSPGGSVPGV